MGGGGCQRVGGQLAVAVEVVDILFIVAGAVVVGGDELAGGVIGIIDRFAVGLAGELMVSYFRDAFTERVCKFSVNFDLGYDQLLQRRHLTQHQISISCHFRKHRQLEYFEPRLFY